MIAHVSATTSRPSCELSEPTGDRESHVSGWGGRLVRVCLAVYLIPVLLVMLLVGAVGLVVLHVAGGAAKLATLIRAALGTRQGDFPL